MKKGIGAIEAQIDSVTAYRQGRGPRRHYDRDWERANREVDREEERDLVEQARARQLLNKPRESRITSIQGERVASGYYDEPFGYCE